ncbi:MAG TPA: extracellular solute-binding protein [Chloroflexota bacterium]|nr:extracellular solute-binding protein [Chloroflexota bacterium]
MRSAVLAAFVLLLAACGGTAAPGGSGNAAAKPATSLSGEARAKWDNLVAAAKKEGKVTLTVGPGGGAQARQVIPPAFKEDFGIDVEVLVSPSTQTISRLKLEQSSGLHTVDVAIGGSDTMYLSFYGEKLIGPMRPMLVHPDVLNGANWSDGKPWFMDPEQQYILRLSNGVTGQTAVNTKLVDPNELKSSDDLLKPQYKGKLAMFDPTINGSGAQHAVFLQVKLGPEYIKKLYVDQQPVRTQDNRQLGDWVGRGNYPIAISMNSATLEQAKQDGLPIKELPPFKETGGYVTAGSGLMAVIKDPPHPSATQLFVNWMALPHGQTVYNRAVQMVSPLTTVKSDWVPSYVVPTPGVDYFDLYDWDYTINTYPKIFDSIRKTLGT